MDTYIHNSMKFPDKKNAIPAIMKNKYEIFLQVPFHPLSGVRKDVSVSLKTTRNRYDDKL